MTVATTSLAAYRSLDLPELEKRVLEIVDWFGVNGCTPDELNEVHPEIEYRSLSPRFAPLERKGLIYYAGDTRPGKSGRQQKVIRHTRHLGMVPVLPVPKKKQNPYVKGLMHAAKLLLASSDLDSAKKALKSELIKATKR